MPRPQTTRPDHAATTMHASTGGYFAFAGDRRDERRRLRWAISAAAMAHLALFLLTFPEIQTLIEVPPPPKVITLRPILIKPPAPAPPREAPIRRHRRVPVPDPTPHLPEPIELPVELAAPIVVPDPPLIGIPEAPPPIPEPSPLRVGGDVAAPVKLFAPPPRYPEIARRAREQGLVVVEAVIDETGAVTRARILTGLRFGLDEAALEAIERWRFEPATLNGKPVAVLYNLTVNFRLN